MKTKLFLAALLCGAMTVPAVHAKTAEELRIYINPGHGSWTGGDRNMGTIKHGAPQNIKDTLGFFESNTDLWKCLGMVDRFEEYGLKIDRSLNQNNPNRALVGAARDLRNNIFMSRVKNGPGPDEDQEEMEDAYNRSLYEICCEVERNNFDMFFSLHSNAASSDLVNYPSLFLRGENKVAGVPGSDTNAKIAWPFAWDQEHHYWTHYSRTNPNVIYDVDFWSGEYAINNIDGKTYKGYYGVLRHGVMGYMAEGYFHTYGPARHRAMNIDVCYDEGDAYCRGIAEIFGLQHESNGTLYGIVRDQHEAFRHTYYNATAKSPDNFKPLNDVKIELLKDGKVIDTYTTDDEWNGAFVFNRLEPGEYYVTASLEGYKKAQPFGPFTVEAAKTTYPRIWLENESYVSPEPDPDLYIDPVTNPAIGAADSYIMSTVTANKEIAELDGKTIRRLIARGDNIYILALDAAQKPTLLVLDADLNVKRQLGTANCTGSYRDLADIQFTADSVLVGSAASVTHYSSSTIDSDFGDKVRGSVNFYRWDNNEAGEPEGEAKVWFNTLASGNLYRGLTANTFVFTGTSKNGQFAFPTASSYGAGRMFFSYIEIIDGEVQNFSINNSGKNTEYLAESVLGLDYTFTPAPYNPEVFIANAPGQPVRTFDINGLDATGDLSTEFLSNDLPGTSFFKYAGHSFLALPVKGGPALVDVTEGVEGAKKVEVFLDILRSARDNNQGTHAAGITRVTTDNQDKVIAADIDMYIAEGKMLRKYTTKGNEQPVVAGVYAYNLASVKAEDGTYKLSFKMSGEANARVELTAEGKEPIVVATGYYGPDAPGAINEVTVDPADLEGEVVYGWQVVVENKAVPGVSAIYTNVDQSGNGVVQNMNTESPYFGTVYYASKSDRALYTFTPDFQMSTPFAAQKWDTSVGASPWRLAVLPNDNLLVSDWGDAHGGIYRIDPAQPDVLNNFFAGTINTGSGEWKYDGKVIGGSTSGLCVRGTGEDTRLYTFQEDYPSDYSLTMACYNIGDADQITTVPDETYPTLSRKLINGNVDVIAADDWMVLSQVRGAGNNSSDVPSFLIGSYNDEVLFTSADLNLNGSDGAIALTPDAKRLFVMDASDVIHVYDINMANATAPLTELYTFEPSKAGEAYQMTLDYAGNLLIAGRSAFQAYTIPCDAKDVVTPAPAAQTITGTSAVESVIVSDNAAPAEYYNLQGVRVAAERLTPGIYIVRKGNTAAKVLVR